MKEPSGDLALEQSALEQAERWMSHIVRVLGSSVPPARFVSEIAAGAGQNLPRASFEQALAALQKDGKIILVAHGAPDPHLRLADLRVAALLSDASGSRAQA